MKKILIVEDDQFLREFYEELLTSEGYKVDSAADGEVGFTKVHQGGWDLILLDIMLPKKDGIQILKQLQTQAPLSPNKAIVALTNLGQDNVINEVFKWGANGYLIKSAMNPEQILAEINTYLK